MTFSEAAAFLRGLQRKEKEEWEKVRRIAYYIVQVNSTKEWTPQEVMPFVWDEKKEVVVDESEIERLRNIAKFFSNEQ